MIKKPIWIKTPSLNDQDVDTFIEDNWIFEPHEENAVRDILSGCKFRKNYDIVAFIELLESSCSIQITKMEERYLRSRATIRENRAKLKRTLSDLQDIIFDKDKAIYEMNDLSHNEFSDLLLELMRHFSRMLPLLNASIGVMNKIEGLNTIKEGRSCADENNFVYSLAECYLMWIDMPVTTDDKPFYKLVQELYKATGMWKKNDPDEDKEPDVRRPVKSAIKKLKEKFPKHPQIYPTKRGDKI